MTWINAIYFLSKIVAWISVGFTILLVLITYDENAEDLVDENEYVLMMLVILWPIGLASLIYWFIGKLREKR